MNFILFDNRPTSGFNNEGHVYKSNNHVAVLQENLGLKLLKLKGIQGLKELRNLRPPFSWLKPRHPYV
jgi:hypothetical protein